MKTALNIFIRLKDAVKIGNVTVVYFDGDADGEFFKGKIRGEGADAQTVKDDGVYLSAKYILEGVDYTGEECKLYVENDASPNEKYTRPKIATDSKALKFLETAPLCGKIIPSNKGLTIEICLND